MHLKHESDILKLEIEEAHLTNNHVFFPELVWELLLGKLSDPDDIESCSNASPYFLKLLEPKRQNKVVIPSVLQQLSRFLGKSKTDGDGGENGIENRKTSMKEFWKLREVCQDWNAAIEYLHESSDVGHFTVQYDMGTFKSAHLLPWAGTSFSPESVLIAKFLDHFEATHYDHVELRPKKNPFLGRCISFNRILVGEHAQNEDEIYFNAIHELAEKYGTEIWYVFFDFRDINGMSLIEIYRSFLELIKLMPNLKALRVKSRRENIGFVANKIFNQSIIIDLLEIHIEQNPIPTLPHLEFLWTTDLPTPIFHEILQKNCHVRKLQVYRKIRHWDYEIFKMELPNLIELGIKFWSPEDFGIIEIFKFHFKLQKFYLRYHKSNGVLKWSRLLSVLGKKLGTSCTALLIRMPLHETENESIQTFNDTHSGTLNLPNLEKVTIVCDSAISFNFLLPAKNSLRTINMYSNGEEDGFVLKRFDEYVSRQQVEFIGFKERMEDSNIWVEFPKLVDLNLYRNSDMGGSICWHKRCARGSYILEKARWYNENI